MSTDYVNLHSQHELAGRLVSADKILTKMRLGFLDSGCFRVDYRSSERITWFHGCDIADEITWLTTHIHQHQHHHHLVIIIQKV